ncbi:hypothetical protein A5N15_11020 [Rothia kristinae]|uniref:ABC-2 type transporter transmembrane domain-containing protein n=1 Tax=Rothia kristinae TaxID=37923 RepID=A0A657ITM6_9MICC|nr:hypothetical protein A5N15_11020 [Rothia kristinae]
MTSLRLALTELKRFSHGVLPKLVMLAVTLIPLLYGGVYLYSNWNPYGRVDNISAALVQSDKGATDESGKHVNTGEDVAKELKDAGNFDWQDVDTRQEAVDKVETGELGFALVIPSDFSQNLLSTSRFKPDENGKTGEVDPQKAGLEIITNDANNYLLTNIVERAGTSVRDSVASQVGDETANQLLASFTDIHGQLTQARDGSQKVTDGTVQLGSAIDRLKGGTSDLVSGSQRLNSGAHQLHDAENQLVDGQRQGLDGAQQLDDGAQQLDSATGQLADGTGQLRSGAGQLKGGTQQLADGSSQLKDGTATLAQGATQLKDGTAQLSSGASQLKDGTAQLSSGASQLKDGTGRLVSGADQLEQGIGQLDTQLKESGISQVGTNLTGVCRDLSSFNDQKATGRLGTDVSNAVVDENAKVVRETLEQKVKDGAIDLTPQQIDAIVSTLGGEEAHQRINAATAKGLTTSRPRTSARISPPCAAPPARPTARPRSPSRSDSSPTARPAQGRLHDPRPGGEVRGLRRGAAGRRGQDPGREDRRAGRRRQDPGREDRGGEGRHLHVGREDRRAGRRRQDPQRQDRSAGLRGEPGG